MKKRVFINGFSAKIGGGKQILFSLAKKLSQHCDKENISYVIFVPNKNDFKNLESAKINFISFHNSLNNTFFVPIVSVFIVPFLMKKFECNILFNLGDIPVRTSFEQIMLFDWSYGIYNEPDIWDRMTKKEFFVRKIKIFLFKFFLPHVNLMLAQTEVTKSRLEDLYKLKNVEIFPNSVALDHLKGTTALTSKRISNKFSLLCLSAYYTHKNLEIFIELGKILKQNDDQVEIFLTIDRNYSDQSKKLLEAIEREGLKSYITNLGPIELKNVPQLYQSVDGMILPTLLESFSGTYVEAMWNKKIILTSDRDFAQTICGESAYYFDPLDAIDIRNKIITAIQNPELTNFKTKKAFEDLSKFKSWDDLYFIFLGILKKIKID